MTAQDEAIAASGKKRLRGRPKEFDVEVRMRVSADLARRVALFAETHGTNPTQAWRTLATLALDDLIGRN